MWHHKDVRKEKFNLIFITIQLSEMHGTLQIKKLIQLSGLSLILHQRASTVQMTFLVQNATINLTPLNMYRVIIIISWFVEYENQAVAMDSFTMK